VGKEELGIRNSELGISVGVGLYGSENAAEYF
jgi:hypothetical protein